MVKVSMRDVESAFEILPGETRQVRVELDPRWAAEQTPFHGWITSDEGFKVVDARIGQNRAPVIEVAADDDPRAQEWIAKLAVIPPGEDLILFVKNTGNRAARYRGRWR